MQGKFGMRIGKMEGPGSDIDTSTTRLTEAQKERVERNREKAKAIRKARLTTTPYDRQASQDNRPQAPQRQVEPVSSPPKPKPVARQYDTRGGFIVDEVEEEERQSRRYKLVEEEAPLLPNEMMECAECKNKFSGSFLWGKFKLCVCDQCRQADGKHSMITKTEAKQRYLLKDCDFGERGGPPLPFLLKRNPHTYGGDMKLYLLCQVESRSHDIWGGKEGLETQHKQRVLQREERKRKKYAKEVKELRRAVRSSMLQPSLSSHEHSFPTSDQAYDPDTDLWTKTCSECGYQITFEKM